MKESICFTAMDKNDFEGEYRIEQEDDVITVVDSTTEEILFSCDWTANIREVFIRALKIWHPDLDVDDDPEPPARWPFYHIKPM